MTADRPWAVVQHADDCGPGMIGEELLDAGCAIRLARADRGDSLPAAGAIAGLVLLGGRMGVHDTHHDWLLEERALVVDAVRSDLPVLGVCLGAQQVALALGGEVATGSAPEIGVCPVTLTGNGRFDPVLGAEYGGLAEPAMPVVEWHSDTFSLPEAAVHLAATRACPNQAFRVGRRVYGFQFHPEIDRRMAEVWERTVPAPAAFLASSRFTEATVVGRRIIRRFVDLALGQPLDRAYLAYGEHPLEEQDD